MLSLKLAILDMTSFDRLANKTNLGFLGSLIGKHKRCPVYVETNTVAWWQCMLWIKGRLLVRTISCFLNNSCKSTSFITAAVLAFQNSNRQSNPPESKRGKPLLSEGENSIELQMLECF